MRFFLVIIVLFFFLVFLLSGWFYFTLTVFNRCLNTIFSLCSLRFSLWRSWMSRGEVFSTGGGGGWHPFLLLGILNIWSEKSSYFDDFFNSFKCSSFHVFLTFQYKLFVTILAYQHQVLYRLFCTHHEQFHDFCCKHHSLPCL